MLVMCYQHDVQQKNIFKLVTILFMHHIDFTNLRKKTNPMNFDTGKYNFNGCRKKRWDKIRSHNISIKDTTINNALNLI